MTHKLFITTASLSAAAVSGYVFYRWLFKEPGHPANWGPTQAIEHLKEHGHLPETLRKNVRRQVADAGHAITDLPLLTFSGMETVKESLPENFFDGKAPAVTPLFLSRHIDYSVKDPAKEKISEPDAVTEIMDIVSAPKSTEDNGISEGPETIEYDTIPEGVTIHHIVTRESDVTDGAIKAFSPAYKALVKKAVKQAEKDENYRLYTTGSTYGLGSRGSSILKVGPASYIHVYDLKNLKKLMSKLTSDTDKA